MIKQPSNVNKKTCILNLNKKQFGRAAKHWISSISTTPLHYLAIDHDVGRWGTCLDFLEIPAGCCPLIPSFPYLLLRHKIGLDFISGKGGNFKASSPHIFSRMSHICCLFTDMVPQRNCYLTKVVNLSISSMQIWPQKNQYRPHDYGSVPSPNKWT